MKNRKKRNQVLPSFFPFFFFIWRGKNFLPSLKKMTLTQKHIADIVGFSAAAFCAIVHSFVNFPWKKKVCNGTAVKYVSSTPDFHSFFFVNLAYVLFIIAFVSQYFDVETVLRSDGNVALYHITTLGLAMSASLTSIALVDGGGAAYAVWQLLFMLVSVWAMHFAVQILFKSNIGPFSMAGAFYVGTAVWLLIGSKGTNQLAWWCKVIGALLLCGFVVVIGLDALDLDVISNNICAWCYMAVSVAMMIYIGVCHGCKAECTMLKAKWWTVKKAAH